MLEKLYLSLFIDQNYFNNDGAQLLINTLTNLQNYYNIFWSYRDNFGMGI